MKREILIQVICIGYFYCNAWLGGNMFKSLKQKNKLGTIFSNIITLLFGSAILFFFFLKEGIKKLIEWVAITTQIKFWYRWHTGKYNIQPELELIEYVQIKCYNYESQKKMSWGQMHFIYCAKKLFARFNIEHPFKKK